MQLHYCAHSYFDGGRHCYWCGPVERLPIVDSYAIFSQNGHDYCFIVLDIS